MKIRWLDAAVDDLTDLRDYIGRDNQAAPQQAAQEIARRLRDAVNALPAHPAMRRPGRIGETRELVIPDLPYIIPYRVRDNSIEILRVIKQALTAWTEQEEERNRLTLEALSDVDTGHTVDQLAVQEWANRLDSDQPLRVPR